MSKRFFLIFALMVMVIELSFANNTPAFTSLEKGKAAENRVRHCLKIKTGAPEKQEIIHAILTNQDVDLSVHESCTGAWEELDGTTIGNYFSALVAAFAEKEFKGMKLKVISSPGTWEPTKESGWKCEVSFLIDDKESPWNRGIVFFMRSKDRSVIRESFMCPGTP